MIESYLNKIGIRCGTVKNFSTVISEDKRKHDYNHWYFLTPIKSTDKGSGLKECTVKMAYPFNWKQEDITEQDVIERLSVLIPLYESVLLKVLRKVVIVSSQTFTVVPFWANEKGEERMERKDFSGNRTHIISATLTILYREAWL